MRRALRLVLLLLVMPLPLPLRAAEPSSLVSSAGTAADSLLLTFVGDIMHHEEHARVPDYDRIYDAVRGELERDDLSFANIEFPVVPGKPPSGYPLFNGSIDYVRAAVRAGFDVFSLANNHTFDWGSAGVRSTAQALTELSETHGIYHNGIRMTTSGPIAPTVIRYRGWTVAFVSITFISNVRDSSPYIHLVDSRDAEAISAFLSLLAQWDDECDLLIVGVHGGTEYVTESEPWKAALFREMVAHGADIVWGHHPHVLQPIEYVETGSTAKLIMHSTGNFVSAQRRYQRPELPVGRWAPTGDTALFQVLVTRVPAGDGTRTTSSVSRVWTPLLTTHLDSIHGYVLRRFGSLLTDSIPLMWRAFFTARYAVTRSFLNRSLTSFVPLIPVTGELE